MRWAYAWVLCGILCSGCSRNIFQDLSNTESDAALFDRALNSVNQADYTGALATVAKMGDSARAERKVLNLVASAYGGQCGVNFLSFVTGFAQMRATRLFPFLLGQFSPASTTRIQACLNAEAALESIGPIAVRTPDENLFRAVVAFAKIGNLLDYYTDSNGNGSADSGVDVCQDQRSSQPSTAVAGNFYDPDLRQIGVGLTVALANLDAVAALTTRFNVVVSQIQTVCSVLPSNMCAISDPTAFDQLDIYGLLTLIKEGAAIGLGIDACAGKDVTVCQCP